MEGLMHRGELAALELREARTHAAVTGAVAAIAAALVLLAGIAGTFAIAASVWERSDRGLILGLVTLAYLLGAAALGWWTARRFRSWQPLCDTFRQLKEDCSCLHDYLAGNSR
jgi:uncharacterized membrane protein YqjE